MTQVDPASLLKTPLYESTPRPRREIDRVWWLADAGTI